MQEIRHPGRMSVLWRTSGTELTCHKTVTWYWNVSAAKLYRPSGMTVAGL
jgi:hypothetical protein